MDLSLMRELEFGMEHAKVHLLARHHLLKILLLLMIARRHKFCHLSNEVWFFFWIFAREIDDYY